MTWALIEQRESVSHDDALVVNSEAVAILNNFLPTVDIQCVLSHCPPVGAIHHDRGAHGGRWHREGREHHPGGSRPFRVKPQRLAVLVTNGFQDVMCLLRRQLLYPMTTNTRVSAL